MIKANENKLNPVNRNMAAMTTKLGGSIHATLFDANLLLKLLSSRPLQRTGGFQRYCPVGQEHLNLKVCSWFLKYAHIP